MGRAFPVFEISLVGVMNSLISKKDAFAKQVLKFRINKKRYFSLFYAGQKTVRPQAVAIAGYVWKVQCDSLGARGQKPETRIDPILFYIQVTCYLTG